MATYVSYCRTQPYVELICDAFSKTVRETRESDNALVTIAEQFALSPVESSGDQCTNLATALVSECYRDVPAPHEIRNITDFFRTLIKDLDAMNAPLQFARALRKAILDHLNVHVTDIVTNASEIRTFVSAEKESLRGELTHRHSRRRHTCALPVKMQATITNMFEVSHPTKGDEHHERVNRLAKKFAQADAAVEGDNVDFRDAARALVVITLADVVDPTAFRQLWSLFVDLSKSLLKSACGRLHGEELKSALLNYNTEYIQLSAFAVKQYFAEVQEHSDFQGPD